MIDENEKIEVKDVLYWCRKAQTIFGLEYDKDNPSSELKVAANALHIAYLKGRVDALKTFKGSADNLIESSEAQLRVANRLFSGEDIISF